LAAHPPGDDEEAPLVVGLQLVGTAQSRAFELVVAPRAAQQLALAVEHAAAEQHAVFGDRDRDRDFLALLRRTREAVLQPGRTLPVERVPVAAERHPRKAHPA